MEFFRGKRETSVLNRGVRILNGIAQLGRERKEIRKNNFQIYFKILPMHDTVRFVYNNTNKSSAVLLK